MIRVPELTPELDDAVEEQDLVRVKRAKGRPGFVFIIREEKLEEMRRNMIESESDRSFYESEGETPLGQ